MSRLYMQFLSAMMIAGCGLLLVGQPARAGSEAVLYSFGKTSKDGTNPAFGVTKSGPDLFGTTLFGGADAQGSTAGGTVYRLTMAGKEKNLHSFGSGTDGNEPIATLVSLGGLLYGVSNSGGSGCSGAGGCGTVFSVSPQGSVKTVYSFLGGSDGSTPNGLIDVNGTLYGTTSYGGGTGCGGTGCGVFFSVTPGGVEKVLYSFQGGTDAGIPSANLINVGGTLYSTSYAGGGTGCGSNLGCGTVFKVTLAGSETVLHAFVYDGHDGVVPLSGLLYAGGIFYGTTANGGGASICAYGCGVVFKLTLAGKETILHAFQGSSDGAYPQAGLVNVNDTLYGTTANGGGTGCGGFGCGTVFSITKRGAEAVAYGFQGGSDGYFPNQGYLLNVAGTLFGTTYYGGGTGCGGNGCGTVFKFTP